MPNKVQLEGIESSVLESWDGWDQSDSDCFIFYKGKLKVDLGPHKAGDEVDIQFDLGRCVISTWADGPQPVYTAKFKLVLEES